MNTSEKEALMIEIAERIVIDYANFSGRESEHRAEFREKVIKHLTLLISHRDQELVNRLERLEKFDYRTPLPVSDELIKRYDAITIVKEGYE